MWVRDPPAPRPVAVWVSLGAAVVACVLTPLAVAQAPGALVLLWPIAALGPQLGLAAVLAALVSLGAALVAWRRAGCMAWGSWLVLAWTLCCGAVSFLESFDHRAGGTIAHTGSVRWREAQVSGFDSGGGSMLYRCVGPWGLLCTHCATRAWFRNEDPAPWTLQDGTLFVGGVPVGEDGAATCPPAGR